MKKICYITIALLTLAAGVLILYGATEKNTLHGKGKLKGTLVKEYGQWKIFYI